MAHQKKSRVAAASPDRPRSSLDGISIEALDTDPDETLGAALYGLRQNGLQIVGVLPFLFFGVRLGYLIVTYDKTKDPRAQPDTDR